MVMLIMPHPGRLFREGDVFLQVGAYGFTLDAWTLKPSDFCSVGVNIEM